jgi:thiol-disulfide isomerase/thioredoxin
MVLFNNSFWGFIMKVLARIISAIAALLLATGAWAGELPYSKAAFDKALAAGQPAIVFFHADWCPTCKAQQPLVQELLKEPRMKNVTVFLADYDKEKDLKKTLRVSSQSTFVVFKAGKEVARSTGQTNKEDLAATFAKAL